MYVAICSVACLLASFKHIIQFVMSAFGTELTVGANCSQSSKDIGLRMKQYN